MSRFLEADQEASKQRVQCRICQYLTELPDDEAFELRELLASRPAPHMVRVLATCDFTTQKSSVQNHQAKHQ